MHTSFTKVHSQTLNGFVSGLVCFYPPRLHVSRPPVSLTRTVTDVLRSAFAATLTEAVCNVT